MKQVYKSGAVANPPPSSGSTSEGFPTEGDVANAIPATEIGAYEFYQFFKECIAVIEDGNIVPDKDVLTQLRDAIRAKYATKTALAAAIAAIPAIDLSPYAPLASPLFTGDPRAPTPADADNDTTIATTAWVKSRIAALVDGAPGALDTLNELAAALNDRANAYNDLLALINGRLTQQQVDARIRAIGGIGSVAFFRGVGPNPRQNPTGSVAVTSGKYYLAEARAPFHSSGTDTWRNIELLADSVRIGQEAPTGTVAGGTSAVDEAIGRALYLADSTKNVTFLASITGPASDVGSNFHPTLTVMELPASAGAAIASAPTGTSLDVTVAALAQGKQVMILPMASPSDKTKVYELWRGGQRRYDRLSGMSKIIDGNGGTWSLRRRNLDNNTLVNLSQRDSLVVLPL